MRKPVFEVSDQVRHKPGCTTTADGYRVEFWILEVEKLYYLFSDNKGTSQLRGLIRKCNQRTNGPVNAHLI